ncbi:MFS transporter [Streptomyces cinerochromogenes]|uniref:MFS transporter n=1 Tax=Streptomyces cinerochromogenes TaxID=66422 RepID=A0ABW7BL49_9ACTN
MPVSDDAAPATEGRAKAAPPWTGRGRAVTVTVLVVASAVVVFLDKVLLGLVATPMSDELHLDAADFGTLASASYVLFGVTCLAAGFTAQRVSPRLLLMVCGLLWAVGQLPAVFAVTGGMLYGSRLLVGAAEGPASPLAVTSLYSWYPNERRGVPTAWYTSGAAIAKIALAPVLTLVIVTFGWRAGFVTVSVLALVWSLGWLAAGRIGPYGAPSRPAPAPAPAGAHGPARPASVPWRTALVNRTFLGCLIAQLTQSALAAVIFTWLPSYFHHALGYSELTAGSLLGLPSVGGIVALFTAGFTADRLVRRGVGSRRARGVLGGSVLSCAGLVLTLLPWIQHPIVSIGILMLGYGGSVSLNTFTNPVLAEIVPPHQRSAILGVLNGLGVSAGAVSPIVSGMLLDASDTPQQGYTLTFFCFGALVAFGGLCFALMVDPERDGRYARSLPTP